MKTLPSLPGKEQSGPLNSGGHTQRKEVAILKHDPPFIQGLESHGNAGSGSIETGQEKYLVLKTEYIVFVDQDMIHHSYKNWNHMIMMNLNL